MKRNENKSEEGANISRDNLMWERAKIVSTIISALIIPVVIGFVGNYYTSAIKERELQGRFVELSLKILDKPPSEGQQHLRSWAIDILDQYSGVRITSSAKNELLTNRTRLSYLDEKLYVDATSLKVESLTLLNKATTPYSEHEKEVTALLLQIEKAYEYAKGQPGKETAAKLWEILKDPNRNSLGGLIKRWQVKGTLNPVFLVEAKQLIADSFDSIIASASVRPEVFVSPKDKVQE
jgi:hypothetical protein